MEYLETFEDMKDKAEQESAGAATGAASAPYHESGAATGTASAPYHDAGAATGTAMSDEAGDDEAFFDSLDELLIQAHDTYDDSLQDFFDGDDAHEVEHADEDIHGFDPYLPNATETAERMRTDAAPAPAGPAPSPAGPAPAPAPDADADMTFRPPTADALNNSYIRVVHTNGIHHLAMVTCQCQGEHRIPLDLVSSNLLPTSFTKIRTLFTVHVLDHFRLCNLELKASAYQFYQLIRRVTLPMRPAEVVNLYHELRRMSRLWRWIKRLKWAGYGHNQKDPLKPEPGSLANFCPACPQVGINIPENWKDDENRWVIKHMLCAVVSKMILHLRFVFKRVFVADGNFKADHVRQENSDADIWLWDGAGMAPNQAEYKQFLLDAIERLTVSTLPSPLPLPLPLPLLWPLPLPLPRLRPPAPDLI
jgi:hypothetical protein